MNIDVIALTCGHRHNCYQPGLCEQNGHWCWKCHRYREEQKG